MGRILAASFIVALVCHAIHNVVWTMILPWLFNG